MIPPISHKRFQSTPSYAALLAIPLIALSTTIHAADVTWDNGGADTKFSTADNWDTNAVPSAEDNALMNIGGTVTYEDGETDSMLNAFIEGGTIFNMTGGTFSATEPGNGLRFVVGRNGAGTVNQSEGTMGIGHLLAIGWGDTGDYNLSGGTLNVSRAGSTLQGSTANASISLGPASGAGTLHISGGTLTTRAGIEIGSNAEFKVSGSQATEIGIGSNNSGDGYWNQLSGATLSVGIDLGGLTKIFVDDVEATNGNFATFAAGSLLDVDYYNGGFGGGTWTVLELENADIVDNGLAFAQGVDTNIWSFNIDNSGTNGILTVTAAGDPAGTFGNWFQIEAEDYDSQAGTQLEDCSDTGEGQNVAYISNGNWCLYEDVTLGDNALLNFRVARPDGGDDGHIEVRLGSNTGTLVAQIDVPETGGWQSWQTISVPLVTTVTGQQDICLVFVETNTTNNGSIFNLNWWSKTAMVEAEDYTAAAGQRFEDTADIGGGQNLGWISNGEWIEYTIEVETAGSHRIDLRVASDNSDGSIDIVSGGQLLSSVPIGPTGGWQTWQTISTYIDLPNTGTQTLRLEFVVPSAGFNLNWFSYQREDEPAPFVITIGNTPQQKMRYGMDYERLWYWGSLSNGGEVQVARWSAIDTDIDFVRVAMNSGYELTENTFNLSAYTSKIIPMMQRMKDANPDIKFFASPRPLDEAVSGASWQPYPLWVTDISNDESDPVSYTSTSYDFGDIKCAEYIVKYLILMKYYGFKISFLDITNEWQSNRFGGRITQEDMEDIHEYLHVTYMAAPWEHPSGSYPGVTLTPDDIPQIVGPSSWSISQGTQWIEGLDYYDDGPKEAISIVSTHNTDRAGDAQSFANAVYDQWDQPGDIIPEIWNTEVHGWKSTSGENETTSFYYYLEAIRAGFGGLNGWLAIGTTNQGHAYILNPNGTPTRNVKYHIFQKLSSTSNYGHALDILEEPGLDVLNAPLDSNDDDIPRNVAAFIKGNLMTVWVINENATVLPFEINTSGNTIATSTVRLTQWIDPSNVEGAQSIISVDSDTKFYTTLPGESVSCFEITLAPETFPYQRLEAEDYSHQWGTNTEDHGSYLNLGDLENNDAIRFGSIALEENSILSFSVARPSGRPDGLIRVREGSADGNILGEVSIPVTGNWQVYNTVYTQLDVEAGIYNLYLEIVEDAETPSGNAFVNFDWFEVQADQEPTNLGESPTSGTSVTLNWDAVPGAIGYTVKRSTTSGGPYAVIDDTITATSYTDTGLTPGTTYFYVIASRYSATIQGDDSDEMEAVPSNPIVAEALNFGQMELGSDGGSGDAFHFSIMNSELGHIYQAQEREDLTTGDWLNVGSALLGNGGVLDFVIPISESDTEYFYRVNISQQ